DAGVFVTAGVGIHRIRPDGRVFDTISVGKKRNVADADIEGDAGVVVKCTITVGGVAGAADVAKERSGTSGSIQGSGGVWIKGLKAKSHIVVSSSETKKCVLTLAGVYIRITSIRRWIDRESGGGMSQSSNKNQGKTVHNTADCRKTESVKAREKTGRKAF